MSLEKRIAALENQNPPVDEEPLFVVFCAPDSPDPQPDVYSTGWGEASWRCERAPGESPEAHKQRAVSTMPRTALCKPVLIGFALPEVAKVE